MTRPATFKPGHKACTARRLQRPSTPAVKYVAPGSVDRDACNRLYNNARWKQASRAFRQQNPLCVGCLANGIVKHAECVDHIVPHRGDAKLFWDVTNWQALCIRCNSRKGGR